MPYKRRNKDARKWKDYKDVRKARKLTSAGSTLDSNSKEPSIARSQLASNQKRRTVTAEIHNIRKTQQQRHKQQQGHKQRNSRDTSDIKEPENSGTKENERNIYIRRIDRNRAAPSTARLYATAGMTATKGTPAYETLVNSTCGVL